MDRLPSLHEVAKELSAATSELLSARELRVSVVIPVSNEARNLPHVLPAIPPWVHEVILVDNHSTDGTHEVAHALIPHVRFIQSAYGRGKGAALRTGFAAATGDIIVTFDGDGSTDPREVPAFVRALLDGADYAKGSRFLPGGGTSDMEWYRKAGNACFVLAVRLLHGGRYTDLCYGYNAFWSRVLAELQLDCPGFEIETQMNVRALKCRLRVAEVPSFEAERIHGSSNLSTIRDGWRVLRTIWRERLVRTRSSAGLAAQATLRTRHMARQGSEPATVRTGRRRDSRDRS